MRTEIRGVIVARLAAACLLSIVVLFASGCSVVHPQHYRSFATRAPVPEDSFLVIGIMGGFEAWNDDTRSVRRTALRLRALDLPNVNVETVQNKDWPLALKLIRNALDCNRDGRVQGGERRSVRLILYGQSLGGAAVVRLAGELKQKSVPVLLTIQVDSVGNNDAVIPANVARAANFYERDSILLAGRAEIRAEDPHKTVILGNWKYDYRHKKVEQAGLVWPKRVVGGAHAKMEFDPDVWNKVEQLIVSEINSRRATDPVNP